MYRYFVTDLSKIEIWGGKRIIGSIAKIQGSCQNARTMGRNSAKRFKSGLFKIANLSCI